MLHNQQQTVTAIRVIRRLTPTHLLVALREHSFLYILITYDDSYTNDNQNSFACIKNMFPFNFDIHLLHRTARSFVIFNFR